MKREISKSHSPPEEKRGEFTGFFRKIEYSGSPFTVVGGMGWWVRGIL